MSTGTCTCDTTELHPVSECVPPGATTTETFIEDVRAVTIALGLGGHARPYSAHAVIHREILPAIARQEAFRGDITELLRTVEATVPYGSTIADRVALKGIVSALMRALRGGPQTLPRPGHGDPGTDTKGPRG